MIIFFRNSELDKRQFTRNVYYFSKTLNRLDKIHFSSRVYYLYDNLRWWWWFGLILNLYRNRPIFNKTISIMSFSLFFFLLFCFAFSFVCNNNEWWKVIGISFSKGSRKVLSALPEAAETSHQFIMNTKDNQTLLFSYLFSIYTVAFIVFSPWTNEFRRLSLQGLQQKISYWLMF